MDKKIMKLMAVLMAAGLMAAGPVAYAESQEKGPEADPGIHEPGPGDEGPEGGPGFHHRGGPGEFFKDLNLTPEQKTKLKAQRESKKESMRALREQMKAKMQALHDEISKPGSKRADVDALLSEVNALKGQMFSNMIDGVFAMKEVLTPEQFAKMQAKHQERMNKKHEGRGKHHEGPGGEGDQPEPPQD